MGCMQKLLAIILGLRDFDNGFMDTEVPDEAQKILNKTCLIWRKVMALRASVIGIEEDGKRVLFEVMRELKSQMAQFEDNYRMDIGRYQPVSDDSDEDSHDDDSESDDDDSKSNSNSNKRRRKRRLNKSDSDSDDDDEPQSKKQRLSVSKDALM